MLIDSHVHIFSPWMRHNRHKLLLRDEGFGLLYQHEKAKLAGAENVIAMLDREGIDRAVIFGFPWQDVELCKQGNDYILESVEKFPGRFIGCISVPWSNSDEALRECERGIKAGARGVGEFALYHQPTDRAKLLEAKPLFAVIEQAGIPLVLHVSEPVGHSYLGKVDIDLKALQDVIAAHPALTIILAHWGGGFFFFELMPEIEKITNNVFYDTAASPLLYDQRIFEVALNIVGEKRILFGSDFPLLSPRVYFKQMEMTIASQEALKKIKGENAKRLFNL